MTTKASRAAASAAAPAAPPTRPTAVAEPEPQPERSVSDVLEGRLRIRLAGQWYILPVLTIGENEDWQRELEAELAPLIAEQEDVASAIKVMESFSHRLLDFIYSYDRGNVLPERGDWERGIYPHELLRAVMEVRLAADPTLAFGVAAFSEEMAQAKAVQMAQSREPSARTSSSPRRTAGRSKKSARR